MKEKENLEVQQPTESSTPSGEISSKDRETPARKYGKPIKNLVMTRERYLNFLRYGAVGLGVPVNNTPLVEEDLRRHTEEILTPITRNKTPH